MIFKVLLRNTPILLIVLAVFILALFGAVFSKEVVAISESQIPLDFISGIFQGNIYYLLLLGILVHTGILFILYSIANELKLLSGDRYLLIFVYLVFLNIIQADALFSPINLSLLMVLLALRLMLLFQTRHSIHGPLMLSAALLSFSGLLFPPSALLFIPSILSLAIFRTFNFREFIIFLIGAALPIVYLLAILYISENLSFPDLLSWEYSDSVSLSAMDHIELVLFSLLSLGAFARIFSNSYKMSVRLRNFFKVWAIFLLFSLSLYFVHYVHPNHILLFSTPFVCLAIAYFIAQWKRAWYWEILLFLIFLWPIISDFFI